MGNRRLLQLTESGNKIPYTPLWRIRFGAIVWFVLGLGFLLSIPILWGWAAWVVAVVLVIAMMLAFPTAWLKKRFAAARTRRRPFVRRWLRAAVAWCFILSMVVAAPIYYFAVITEIKPAIIPQVTLTNGTKTVVLQGMQHIGSENFYKAVIYDIEKAIADGYVIYYEGVQTATPESKEFFNALTTSLTGFHTDLGDAYTMMGETIGLKFQNEYFSLLQADQREHPERHVVADVDAIELKAEYARLMRTDPTFAKNHAADFKEGTDGDNPGTAIVQAVEWLKSGTKRQRELAGLVARGVLTLTFPGEQTEEPGRFDPLILDFRNRVLAQRILNDTHNHIFITYGSKHLPGVVDMLRQKDPAWAVASVKWMRTIEIPAKHLEGRLALPGTK